MPWHAMPSRGSWALARFLLGSFAMLERVDIFRRHGPDYRAPFGSQMPPAHLRAMQDIEQCRTESLGGQMSHGEPCRDDHDSSHSCKHRPCPTCHNAHAEQWLEHQQRVLLPVPPCLVTFTLPEVLRALARSHPKTVSSLLLRAASAAFQALALDPRGIGGRGALVGGLHPWPRALRYHPHVHDIATGGGLDSGEAGGTGSPRLEPSAAETPHASCLHARLGHRPRHDAA